MNSMPRWSVSGGRVETGEGQGWERKGEHKQSYSYRVIVHVSNTSQRVFTCSLIYASLPHLLSRGVRRHVWVSHDTWNAMQGHMWTHSTVFKTTQRWRTHFSASSMTLAQCLRLLYGFFLIILIDERVLKVQMEIRRTGNIWMKC